MMLKAKPRFVSFLYITFSYLQNNTFYIARLENYALLILLFN